MTCNETLPAHPLNYSAGRTQRVQYLVLHYTAGDGDTARENCLRFHTVPGLKRSFHYFVDENGVWRSVREDDTARHVASNRYVHPFCRDENSLGISLCSRTDVNDNYYFRPETVDRAAALVLELMERYHVPPENVLRHFDVTEKLCPAPFVDSGRAWTRFLSLLGE